LAHCVIAVQANVGFQVNCGSRWRVLEASKMMLWTAPTLRHRCAKGGCVEAHHIEGEPSMGEVSTIGLDIAKSVFQVHGADADGAVVIRKRISRAKVLEFFAAVPPCLVGIEACPSAHHWSRKLQALGHTVKLMPPSYVKAYLKRSKNDANDAAAICEAVTRPSMRFVPIKSEQQQSGLMLHRCRQLLVRHQSGDPWHFAVGLLDAVRIPVWKPNDTPRASHRINDGLVERLGQLRHFGQQPLGTRLTPRRYGRYGGRAQNTF
jgi:hypothetical protein